MQSEPPLPHVFIGGTGRSGTTVLAQLLGRHSQFAQVPFELKFHTQPGGLTDLLTGATTLEQFELKLRQRWWHRERSDGRERGLSQILTPQQFEDALHDLRVNFKLDSAGAAGSFLRTVLGAWAAHQQRPACVEATPSNVFAPDLVEAMVPGSKFIHIRRDGRDVAASVVRKPWGPNSHAKALRWWSRRLERAENGMARLAPDRGRTIQLEQLVRDDRERTYEELLAFLQIDDEPPMRGFFEVDMAADAANVGRWRADVPDEEREAFEALYADALGHRRESETSATPVV